MNREEIFSKIGILYCRVMGKKELPAGTGESSSLKEDLGLDSISTLYLVLEIEREFGIKFENQVLTSFVTVGEVEDYIAEKLKLGR